MTIGLFGATIYISSLLSSSTSPTQIKKSKAAAITYKRTVDFNFPTENSANSTNPGTPTDFPNPEATLTPALISNSSGMPTSIPTQIPTPVIVIPTLIPTVPIPTALPTPTTLPTPTLLPTPTALPTPTSLPSPTTQPLLAYNSTSISPTLIPATDTGGMIDPTKAPTPTQKIKPTGVQQLPETGWIQTSSILFIVAVSTIFFSLLF